MKIRAGFVSNSSSSSFVIFGNRIDAKDVKENIGNIYAYAEGSYCSDGEDFFEVDDEMLDYFRKNPSKAPSLYRVFLMSDTIYLDKKQLDEALKNLPDNMKFEIFALDVSYHITESLHDYIERYTGRRY